MNSIRPAQDRDIPGVMHLRHNTVSRLRAPETRMHTIGKTMLNVFLLISPYSVLNSISRMRCSLTCSLPR